MSEYLRRAMEFRNLISPLHKPMYIMQMGRIAGWNKKSQIKWVAALGLAANEVAERCAKWLERQPYG